MSYDLNYTQLSLDWFRPLFRIVTRIILKTKLNPKTKKTFRTCAEYTLWNFLKSSIKLENKINIFRAMLLIKFDLLSILEDVSHWGSYEKKTHDGYLMVGFRLEKPIRVCTLQGLLRTFYESFRTVTFVWKRNLPSDIVNSTLWNICYWNSLNPFIRTDPEYRMKYLILSKVR